MAATLISATHSLSLNRPRPYSVINANMHVLLARRKYLLLFLTLQVGQLVDCLCNDSERSLNLLLGDDKRRRQTDDVLVSGLGLQQR
jgi:hypothetical protein